MKHPLTSKERRGLVAVAASALLCIASGFIFRSCHTQNGSTVKTATEVTVDSNESRHRYEKKDTAANKKKNKSKSRSSGKKKTKVRKTYPTRDPLSQPCD
ncbi:MAG: hypothetical protein K2G13_06805 [Muribaculaceae bacterium]|nr:hypothetical protein [Muribaculaceae bacterium]